MLHGLKVLLFPAFAVLKALGAPLIHVSLDWLGFLPEAIRNLVYMAMQGAVLLCVMAGILVAWQRQRFLLITFVMMCCGLLVFQLAGKLPFLYRRHFLFLVPLASVFAGLGLWTLVALLMRPVLGRKRAEGSVTAIVALILCLVCGAATLGQAQQLRNQQVSPLVAYLEAQGAEPDTIWVYQAAQPYVAFAKPYFADSYIGRVPHHSGQVPGWIWQNRNLEVFASSGRLQLNEGYLDKIKSDLFNLPMAWLLIAQQHDDEKDQMLAAAEDAIGPCAQVIAHSTRTFLYRCEAVVSAVEAEPL